MKGRKIKYVKLTDASNVFLPGFGSFGKELPPKNKHMSISMLHEDAGVLIEVDGGRDSLLIAWHSVSCVQYGPKDKGPASSPDDSV